MVLHLKEGTVFPVKLPVNELPIYYVDNLDFDYIYFKDDKQLLDNLYSIYGECYIINIGTKAVEGVFLLTSDEVSNIPLTNLDNFIDNKYKQCLDAIRFKVN